MSAAALLDVNVLLALLWRPHAMHGAAMKWFTQRGRMGWATSALTQTGFVRVLSNPAFTKTGPRPHEAIAILGQSIADPHHQFWKEPVPITDISESLRSRIQGHKQITDAYLLTLAVRNKGSLVTFDYRMASLPARGSSEEKALLVLRP